MPTQPLGQDAERLLQAELKPGEKILWSGAPLKGQAVQKALGPPLIGLLFLGCAVYWFAGVKGVATMAAP